MITEITPVNVRLDQPLNRTGVTQRSFPTRKSLELFAVIGNIHYPLESFVGNDCPETDSIIRGPMGNAKTLLLLGGNKLNQGIWQKFKSLGYEICVADWNESPDIKGDLHLRVDVKDLSAVKSALATLKIERNNIRLAYTSIDLAAEVAIQLNREIYGLENSKNDARRTCSKHHMTSMWNKHGYLNRISYQVDSNDELKILEDTNLQNIKIIVKPNISSSSRGITILEKKRSALDVKAALKKSCEESYDKKAVIEEFVAGTEYTAEMICDNYGQVLVYGISQKHHSIHLRDNKVATKLLYNFANVDLQNRIADYAKKCFELLEPRSCLGHMEIIATESGLLCPIEIGFRSSGFIASHLVDAAYDTDYLSDFIDILSGRNVTNSFNVKNDISTMYYFYDAPPGRTLKHPLNILDYLPKTITTMHSLKPQLVSGSRVPSVTDDNQRLGYELLKGPRGEMDMELIISAEKKMIEENIC